MTFADTLPTTVVPPPVSNATPPTNPVNGQMWFNPITMAISVWDGSVWKPVGSAGGGIVSGGVAPATPNIGDAWFNTSSATLFINYDDGDSTQWVSTAKAGPPGPVGPPGPAGPPGPIAPGNGVGINAAKQIIVIDDGTF